MSLRLLVASACGSLIETRFRCNTLVWASDGLVSGQECTPESGGAQSALLQGSLATLVTPVVYITVMAPSWALPCFISDVSDVLFGLCISSLLISIDFLASSTPGADGPSLLLLFIWLCSKLSARFLW
jgi:hypothetical protein